MKIVLDAGHGPNTAGKRAPDGSMREFQFNSAVAKYARDMLLNYEDVSVHFVHDETEKHDIALIARTNTANNIKADVYVSIHANASSDEWSTANGIETFHHPKSSEVSKKLAAVVQSKLIAKTKLRDRGVKQNDYHVLRETNMPAILVECGFMNNKDEVELLKSESYRKLCAEAIVEGLVEFYKLKKKQINNTSVAQATFRKEAIQEIKNAVSDKRFTAKHENVEQYSDEELIHYSMIALFRRK